MTAKKIFFAVVGTLLFSFLFSSPVLAATEIRLKQMLPPIFITPVIKSDRMPVSVTNGKVMSTVVAQGKKVIAQRITALNLLKKQIAANKNLNAQQKKAFSGGVDSEVEMLNFYRKNIISEKDLAVNKDRVRRLYKLMPIFSFTIPEMKYDIAFDVLDNHGNNVSEKLKILQNKIANASKTKDVSAWQTAFDKAKASLAALQNDLNNTRGKLYGPMTEIKIKQPENYDEMKPVFAAAAKSIKRINQGYTALAQDLLKAKLIIK